MLGTLSREALLRWRNRMLAAGSRGKMIFGAILLAAGLLVLTGLDKRVEAALIDVSPDWLTELTTRFEAASIDMRRAAFPAAGAFLENENLALPDLLLRRPLRCDSAQST